MVLQYWYFFLSPVVINCNHRITLDAAVFSYFVSRYNSVMNNWMPSNLSKTKQFIISLSSLKTRCCKLSVGQEFRLTFWYFPSRRFHGFCSRKKFVEWWTTSCSSYSISSNSNLSSPLKWTNRNQHDLDYITHIFFSTEIIWHFWVIFKQNAKWCISFHQLCQMLRSLLNQLLSDQDEVNVEPIYSLVSNKQFHSTSTKIYLAIHKDLSKNFTHNLKNHQTIRKAPEKLTSWLSTRKN